MMTPPDYLDPNWGTLRNVRDWKVYISIDLAAMWLDFTDAQRKAIAENAQVMADMQEWE